MTLLGKSDVGRVRPSNQDNFTFHEFNERDRFAVVCDGMGGHKGGNIASEIAVKTVKEVLITGYNSPGYENKMEALIREAVRRANDTVYSAALKNPDLKGMGTTIVLVLVYNDTVYVAHAGDSRAYLYHNKKLKRLTKDHSFVQEMIEIGQITNEEAEKHPYKNIITRALGNNDEVEIDCVEFKANEKDLILLCSDGLSNLIPDKDIETIVNNEFSEDICEKLINEANERGGFDNITVVLVKCK